MLDDPSEPHGQNREVEEFRADLDLTLGLSGQTTIDDLDRSVLVDAER